MNRNATPPNARFVLLARRPARLDTARTLASSAVVLGALAAVSCAEPDPKRQPYTQPSEPSVTVEDDLSAILPVHPRIFRIELSGSACFGDCPIYSTSIDQSGSVTFVGQRCVARPGVWQRQVTKEDAREVYDALTDARFAAFGSRYVDEEDGCELITDAPTNVWKVSADGKKKSLKHYTGCLGIEGLDAIDDVRKVMLDRAGVATELNPPYRNCDGWNRISDTSFRLSVDGAPKAVLQIKTMYAAPRFFELRDCAGEVIAQGDAHTERARLVLIGEALSTITLPADLGEAASLVLDFEEPESRRFDSPPVLPRSGRALRSDGDLDFDLTVRNSCD